MSRVDPRLVGLAVIWLVWAVGAEVVSIRAGVVENHVLDLGVGAAYLVGGLVALHRRTTRLGLLMVTVAFLWFIGNYGNANLPGVAVAGSAFGGISLPLVVWLFFAYPSGRMQTAAERVYIGVFALWEVASGVVAVASDLRAVPLMESAGGVLDVLLPIGGGILLGLKYRRASVVERRALAPLWVGGVLLVIAFGIDGLVGGEPVRDRAAYTLFQLESVARLAVPLCFLWALLRSNLDRGGVGDLVERLSHPIPAGGLRAAMADVLHDPQLRLLFPLADAWVDEGGRPVADPVATAGAGVSRIERDGRTLAVVHHDPAIDRAVIAAAGAATAMALDNARLHAELRARLEEVRASRSRIVKATDLERRRIERDLHDGAQQRLLALSFRLRAARRHGATDSALMADLDEAESELRGAIEELRNLARGIHPVLLTDEGLLPALEALADRAPLPVTISTTLKARPPPAVEGAAYFVVAESLTNAARYAATPVDVRVELRAGCLVVSVIDEGPGGADSSRGSGLRGLADRVEAVDGRLTVTSPRGAGTTVTAELPCA